MIFEPPDPPTTARTRAPSTTIVGDIDESGRLNGWM
jgi:hypothetical protein